jgi:hypothetical protein
MITIYDSLTKPASEPIFEKKTFNRSWIGVELEFETKDKNAQEYVQKLAELFDNDFVIFKHDNSLNPVGGFEICSCPASLEIHKEKWKQFFKEGIDGLQLFDNKLGQNCGMHVHMNREPLSELQVGKVVAFIHNEKNRKFIELVAGRTSKKEVCDFEYPREIKHAKHEYSRELNREMGVNLHNLKTIEFRIFKSTLDYNIFIKNLEFCQALIEFTSPSHTNIKESIDYKEFLEFLEKRKNDYSYLVQFLKRK